MSSAALLVLAGVIAFAALLFWRGRRGFAPRSSAPEAAASRAPAGNVDENVQFTVFRPLALDPGRWQTLLAFAHLSERRPGSPVAETDPVAEVQRQAAALLGDMSGYRPHTEDSLQAVPRNGALTFVPTAEGIEFNPSSRAFDWTEETVHREEFRMRAGRETAGRVIRGRLTVYLHAIVLAEIGMALRVEDAASTATDESTSDHARPYRKVFASYSHRDSAIVEEFAEYARAMGDRYLRDVIDLRSGEQWKPALEQLIREADVFQLFWSWNAIESPHVRREWAYALSLKRPSFVRPVYWSEPLPERDGLPPESLRSLHFERIQPRAVEAALPAAPQPRFKPQRRLVSALATAALLAVILPTILLRTGPRPASQPPDSGGHASAPAPAQNPPEVAASRLVQKAEIAWGSGQSEQALANLQEAMSLAPDHPSARALLVRIENDVNARLKTATADARQARVAALRPQAHAAAQRDEREAQTALAEGRPLDAIRRRIAEAAKLEGAATDAAVPLSRPGRSR